MVCPSERVSLQKLKGGKGQCQNMHLSTEKNTLSKWQKLLD
jgi:hypothetical protein